MAIVDDLPGALALREQAPQAREFAGEPLPPKALRRTIDAGRNAQSLFYTRPLRFVVVRNHAKYDQLRAGCNTPRVTFMKLRGIFGRLNKRVRQPLYEAGLLRRRSGDIIPAGGVAIVVLQDDAFPESSEACPCALMALEATACVLVSHFTSGNRGQKEMVAMIGVPKGFNRLRKNSRRRLDPACSAESFVALRSQRCGVARVHRAKPRAPISSLLVSTKHSGPIRTPRVFPQPVKMFTSIVVGNPTHALIPNRKNRRSLDAAVRRL